MTNKNCLKFGYIYCTFQNRVQVFCEYSALIVGDRHIGGRKEVLDGLKNYTKPKSKHILLRYQLTCFKQCEFELVNLFQKIRLLVDDSAYQRNFERHFSIWT